MEPAKNTNKKVKVYEDLRQRIISGALRPGLPINEADFAAQLEVSKTPIREALRQLEREGFVENVPGRGSTISHITSQEIRDVFEIREIIESGVTKRVAQLKGNQELQNEYEKIRKYLETHRDSDELVHEFGIWEDMHFSLVKALGNQTLLQMYKGILDRITRIRNHYGKSFTGRRLHDILTEHAEILEAVVTGEATEAEDKLRYHLQNAGKFLLGLSLGQD